MLKKRPKSLSELVEDTDSALGRLAGEAQARLDLADHMRSGLSPELANHFAGCNMRDDGTLVVLTTGPEWASRLRFEAEKLLSVCREYHPEATRVKIRVAHETS